MALTAAAAIFSFLLFSLANGMWWCWWFGTSFGNRAFIEVIPILALTAAVAASRARLTPGRAKALAGLIVVGVGLNLYLWTGYMLYDYPRDGSASVAQLYLWPLHTHESGLRLDKSWNPAGSATPSPGPAQTADPLTPRAQDAAPSGTP